MNQKGFTFIELLVVMGIGGIVLSGIVLTIHQTVWTSARSNSQVVALADLNQSAHRLKKDLQMAHHTGLTADPQSWVNLTWADNSGFAPADPPDHSCNYVLSGANLTRTYDGTVSIVGRHITSIEFTRDDEHSRVVNVVMTATGPGAPQRSETISFSVYMRSEEIN